MIIGITGKSGSGKSTIAKNYEQEGYFLISFDEIGHQVIDEHKEELEKIFGTSDRKQLGDLIFNNRALYKELSEFCWKHMENIIDNQLNHEKIVMDFILLPHTKYWNMCDKKILCICSDEIRKQRVLQRDGITEEYFLARDKASIEYNEDEMDEIIRYPSQIL